MNTIKLITEKDIRDVAALKFDAYPGTTTRQTIDDVVTLITANQKREDVNYYCVHRGDALVGSFNVWDFHMNLRGAMIDAAGVGSVQVALAHKKEKIAYELMQYYLNNLQTKGQSMALLYPFNSAFYHKMGFGFGTLLQQLRIKPGDISAIGKKDKIKKLTIDDAPALTAFYNTQVKKQHGLIQRAVFEFEKLLNNPAMRLYAVIDEGIEGYVMFSFRKGSDESVLVNDLFVNEMLFDHPRAFMQIMSFLKSQSDQIRYLILNTQDEGLLHTIADPRNHMDRLIFSIYQEVSRTGLGIMYRVVDVVRLLDAIKTVQFKNLNLTIAFDIKDSFMPINNKEFITVFKNGYAQLAPNGNADVTISLNIADFSALIMGTNTLHAMVKFGLAIVSDTSLVDTISGAFSLDQKPVCLTYF